MDGTDPEETVRRDDLEPVASDDLRDALRNGSIGGPLLGPGSVVGGDFVLASELGRGGMGVVFLALQRSLGRRVALKVLAPHALPDEHDRERFRREGSTMAQLSHPNVLKVYQVGEDGGLPWLALELVDGTSLDRLLANGSDRPAPEADGPEPEAARRFRLAPTATACRWIADIADALHHAHGFGVVHRDVKPGNILIQRDGTPKLGDFGLARRDPSSSLTRTGDVFGTLRYMSPEQVRGERDVDARADVYSLGVTLFELLTRRSPFAGGSVEEVVHAIRTRRAPGPRDLERGLPRDLDTIVRTAMEPDRERRYRTAADLAGDLRRFLAYEPILARPVPMRTRVARWIARNRAATAAIAGPIVIVLAASVIFGFVERRAAQDLRRAAAREAFTTAGALARRGRFAEALDGYGRALELGYEDEVAVQLGRVEALSATFDTAGARRLLAQLAVRDDLGRHTAKLWLLEGTMPREDPWLDAAGLHALQRAIDTGGLSPEDEAFARAFLCDDLEESAAWTAKALEHDRAHLGAAALRSTLLLLLQRPDEAQDVVTRIRTLYPDNVMGAVYEGTCRLLLFDDAQGPGEIDELPAGVRAFLASLAAALDVVREVDVAFAAKATEPNDSPLAALLRVAPFLPRFAALALSMQRIAADASDSGLRLAVPLPRSVSREFERFAACFGGSLFGALAAARDSARRWEMIEASADLLQRRRNGVVRFWTGLLLQVEGRFADAESQFRRAAEEPFLVPLVRAPLVLEWIAQIQQVPEDRGFDRRQGEALRRRARETAARAIRLGGWPPAQWRLFVIGANNHFVLPDLADDVTAAWCREHPKDAEAWYSRAVVQENLGAPVRARALVDEALSLDPDHAQARAMRGRLAERP